MRSLMRGLLAACLLCVAPAFGQAAGAPPSAEQVDHLMRAMGVERMLDAMAAQLPQMMREAARMPGRGALNPAQQAVFDRYLSRMMDLMLGGESRPRFMAMMREIYGAQFNAAEVADIIRFYESPTGRALVERMPQLTQDSTRRVVEWMSSLKPQIDQLAAEMAAEMKAAAEAPAPEPRAATPVDGA